MRALCFVMFGVGVATADPAKTASTSTGVLDLELTSRRDGAFVLHDAAYEMTFPGKPEIVANDANDLHIHGALATYADESTLDLEGLFMLPIPADVQYDPDVGMAGARDQALKNVGGKIVRETDEKLDGLAVRHTVGAAKLNNHTMQLDLYIGWDSKHRTLVGVMTGAPDKQTEINKAFVRSFKYNAAGAAPPAKATK